MTSVKQGCIDVVASTTLIVATTDMYHPILEIVSSKISEAKERLAFYHTGEANITKSNEILKEILDRFVAHIKLLENLASVSPVSEDFKKLINNSMACYIEKAIFLMTEMEKF